MHQGSVTDSFETKGKKKENLSGEIEVVRKKKYRVETIELKSTVTETLDKLPGVSGVEIRELRTEQRDCPILNTEDKDRKKWAEPLGL